MGNGLRDYKMMLNPKGILGSEAKRQKKQSETAKALGFEDPYKKKKKKKKNSGTFGIRNFMQNFIKTKESKMNSQ